MTPDLPLLDAIIETAKPKVPTENKYAFLKVKGLANKAMRIRNRLFREYQGAVRIRIARALKDIAILRKGGVEPTPELLAKTRGWHAPVPRALQGQVKQRGRTFDRLLNARIRAKKVREPQEEKPV